MKKAPIRRTPTADPAAIFAGALSIWTACNEAEDKNPDINLSDIFNGVDELMRVSMATSTLFENWACKHIDFDKLSDWWPYKLQMEMGDACLELWEMESLPNFDEERAMTLAMKLALPLKREALKLLPLYLEATNPTPNAKFCRIYIQLMREAKNGDGYSPIGKDDDPSDLDFSAPFYGIYGVDSAGFSEHIADRATSRDAVETVKGLIPAISFK